MRVHMSMYSPVARTLRTYAIYELYFNSPAEPNLINIIHDSQHSHPAKRAFYIFDTTNCLISY